MKITGVIDQRVALAQAVKLAEFGENAQAWAAIAIAMKQTGLVVGKNEEGLLVAVREYEVNAASPTSAPLSEPGT